MSSGKPRCVMCALQFQSGERPQKITDQLAEDEAHVDAQLPDPPYIDVRWKRDGSYLAHKHCVDRRRRSGSHGHNNGNDARHADQIASPVRTI